MKSIVMYVSPMVGPVWICVAFPMHLALYAMHGWNKCDTCAHIIHCVMEPGVCCNKCDVCAHGCVLCLQNDLLITYNRLYCTMCFDWMMPLRNETLCI